MELKKNPQVDLSRDSGLYFVIGLTIVLFAVWRMLEHKTYSTAEEFVTIMQVMDDIDEEVPVTHMQTNFTPPPPPAAPDVISIVEDMEEVEETLIESTESSQDIYVNDAVVAVDEVEVVEEEEEITVPFAVIEEVPIFPGCEGLADNEARKACFNQKIQEHIKNNFKYPSTALELGIQGKVYVQFEINSKGKVAHINKRGPDKLLEDEAVRIIAMLPNMTPGNQRGRPATVRYGVPINFVMQ
ncbi:energy transducer TonB [Flavobacterium sp. ASW18X]|uniref:energy transducer TonB n=1 Tax=Flavobacterium sp. ASW18X TaxID=2572595 RepID=UPI0010AED260|nr:energy transducer TonB [Flavobacterium sp. ASW18X]TKD63517.1 energy transducer TonB [Flavobacterium sp. ASW18X]